MANRNPKLNRILTGFFQEKTGYRARRSRGTHDWLLIYTIRGAGDFGYGNVIDGFGTRRFATSAGDLVVFKPGVLHDYRVHESIGTWDLLWAHFHPRPDWSAWMDWANSQDGHPGLSHLPIPDVSIRKQVEDLLYKMHRVAVSSYPQRDHLALNALEEALLWCSTQTANSLAQDFDPRVVQAQEYLCQHLHQSLTLKEVAEFVGISVSHLSHLFRRHAGVTPQKFIEYHRLERARHLLELTAMPIKQIAVEVGFENPFYFTLRFKRHTRQSPRAYRKACLAKSAR